MRATMSIMESCTAIPANMKAKRLSIRKRLMRALSRR